MLLTNFSAGELSENLFGRTDLPQYYAGAARLENFDVIPTGGIERRAGTERLLPLDAEGRLIPFIIDRQRHLLLYLTPDTIQVIANGAVQETIVSSETFQLYRRLSDITAVQYAQNFDTMILAHEGYAPLLVKYADGGVTITTLTIHDDVELKVSGDVDTAPFVERDAAYADTGYLTTEDHFPRAVTFFNGRLVFAGTRRSPQRLFASKTGDIHSFATYKTYLTERKNYITVHCTVQQNSSVLTLHSTAEGLKFTEPLAHYFLDTPYFPAGTRVLELRGSTLRVDHPSLLVTDLTGDDLRALDDLIWLFNAHNQYKYEHLLSVVMGGFDVGEVKIAMGSSEAVLYVHSADDHEMMYESHSQVPYNAAALVESNPGYLQTFIITMVQAIPYPYMFPPELLNVLAGQAAVIWGERILNTMRYTFMGYTYYDYAPAIKLRIQQFMLEGSNVYIPLFTRAVIADRYPTPDDGFTVEIASDLSDAIRWLAVNKGIIIGTETAEWIIPPGVTAVNVQAALNSQYGSDAIQGTVINDAACFFQSGKKALVEYYIPQQDNNFRANNMALLSARLLAESPAAEFDYIRSPYTKLFITRADGQVVTLLYERSTGVFAWGRISTAGAVQSVAVLPGADGNDDVYLVVKRAGQYFLERLREAAEVYLDSFQRWTGANEDYADTAVIVDADGEQWIGYPYTSLIRTMPVLANNQLKKQRITTLLFRFLRSFLPTVSAIAGGRRIQTDLITNLKTPYSGIHRIPFPGTWDEDVQIELTCDKPEPVRILALNAEVQ